MTYSSRTTLTELSQGVDSHLCRGTESLYHGTVTRALSKSWCLILLNGRNFRAACTPARWRELCVLLHSSLALPVQVGTPVALSEEFHFLVDNVT